jgi:hypothetical protein
MQGAIHALRHLRAETGSTYPLPGKCVNHFILRVFINTNWTKSGKVFCSTGFSLWIFASSLSESQILQAEVCATKS